jgi:hypothetical protein
MPIRQVKWAGFPAAVILSIVLAGAAPQGASGPPDPDFLEFLGSWDSGDEHPKWVDPFQLDDAALTEGEQPNESSSHAQGRNQAKRDGIDDERASRRPSPYSVRPEGGVKP